MDQPYFQLRLFSSLMHQPALVELFQTQFGSSPLALAWFVVSLLLLRPNEAGSL